MNTSPRSAHLALTLCGWLVLLANVSRADVTYDFTNFDGLGNGTNPGTGTNMNGIANNGAAVGFGIADSLALTNFIRNADGSLTALSAINGNTAAMALGINSAGDVVGTDGNGNAFFLPKGGSVETLTTPAGASTAFGINDNGNIVGQFTSGMNTPGFFLFSNTSASFTRIDAPSGSASDVVNAQGINNKGLVVGFYLGNDGNVHGFDAQIPNSPPSELVGTAISDPSIPPVSGEPGATFVFSQILGINDNGLAVGYYQDSTGSQHGFLYNTNTGKYTFLDDPSAAFDNAVEITQITGITNSGEITGFYSDANDVFHGFVANPVPEPASLLVAGLGFMAMWVVKKKKGMTRN